MTLATTPFGPEHLRAPSLDAYLANETDTDQWNDDQHEAIPEKAAVVAVARSIAGNPRSAAAIRATAAQFRQAVADGDDALQVALAQAILTDYHDILWYRGEHPYWDTVDQLLEQLDAEADGGEPDGLLVDAAHAYADALLAQADRLREEGMAVKSALAHGGDAMAAVLARKAWLRADQSEDLP